MKRKNFDQYKDVKILLGCIKMYIMVAMRLAFTRQRSRTVYSKNVINIISIVISIVEYY